MNCRRSYSFGNLNFMTKYVEHKYVVYNFFALKRKARSVFFGGPRYDTFPSFSFRFAAESDP